MFPKCKHPDSFVDERLTFSTDKILLFYSLGINITYQLQPVLDFAFILQCFVENALAGIDVFSVDIQRTSVYHRLLKWAGPVGILTTIFLSQIWEEVLSLGIMHLKKTED